MEHSKHNRMIFSHAWNNIAEQYDNFPFPFLFGFLLLKEIFWIKILRRFSLAFSHKARKSLRLRSELPSERFWKLQLLATRAKKNSNKLWKLTWRHFLFSLFSPPLSGQNIIAEASEFSSFVQVKVPFLFFVCVGKRSKNFSTEIDFHIIYDAFSRFSPRALSRLQKVEVALQEPKTNFFTIELGDERSKKFIIAKIAFKDGGKNVRLNKYFKSSPFATKLRTNFEIQSGSQENSFSSSRKNFLI